MVSSSRMLNSDAPRDMHHSTRRQLSSVESSSPKRLNLDRSVPPLRDAT